jgi:hypothetical protein
MTDNVMKKQFSANPPLFNLGVDYAVLYEDADVVLVRTTIICNSEASHGWQVIQKEK